MPTQSLGSKVVRGMSVTLIRNGLVYLSAGAASIVLTKLLVPRDFGIYAIVSSINILLYQVIASGFISLFIVRHDADERAIDAVFWLIFACLIPIAIGCLAVSLLGDWSTTTRLFLLAISAFAAVSSLRFPVIVRLNRTLQFNKLAVVDVGEVIVFNIASISFAVAGCGVRSFAYATLCAAGTIFIAVIFIGKWRPTYPALAPAWPWFRPALVYFYNSWLMLLREVAMIPALVLVVGKSQVGLYGWALAVAASLIYFTTVTTNVIFPALTQIRSDRQRIYTAVSLAQRLNIFGSVMIAILLASSLPAITNTIFSPHWLPAVPIARLLLSANVVLVAVAPLVKLIQADNQTAFIVRWEIVFLIIVWPIGLPIAYLTDTMGFAAAYTAACCLTTVITIRYARQHYQLVYEHFALCVVIIGIGSAIIGALVQPGIGQGWLGIIIPMGLTILVYSSCLLAVPILRRQLIADLREAWKLYRAIPASVN